jgi:hypothetical protein
MGGFLGIGQSGAQKTATSNLQNIFNYALPQAEASETAGTNALASAEGYLGQAGDYFNKLLTAGRTETAQNAAPAINARLAQADAARRAEAAKGTNRGGGTAEVNREAGATTQADIDKIINDNLIGGKQAGAQGLAQVGSATAGIGSSLLSSGQGLLGAAGGTEGQVLSEADQIAQNESNLGGALGGALIKGLFS